MVPRPLQFSYLLTSFDKLTAIFTSTCLDGLWVLAANGTCKHQVLLNSIQKQKRVTTLIKSDVRMPNPLRKCIQIMIIASC